MGAPDFPPLAAKRLTLSTLPPHLQFEQWREHMDHVIDVTPNGQPSDQGFNAELTVYRVGEVVVSRCVSDAVVLPRSLARISTTGMYDYMFQVFLGGDAGIFDRPGLSLQASNSDIMVLDLNEPVVMRRGWYDAINLFIPRHMVDAWLPAGVELHCAQALGSSPLTAIARSSIMSFMWHLPGMPPEQAKTALNPLIQLLVAAASGPGNSSLIREVNAKLQADAALAPARQYIETHLDDASLDAPAIARHLGVSRSQLYRLFQRYGGVAAYILRLRLRHAATELVRNPSRPITEIAYGLGFSSPSDFSRAFRRFYGYSPRDVRQQSAAMPNEAGRMGKRSSRPNRPFLNWLENADSSAHQM